MEYDLKNVRMVMFFSRGMSLRSWADAGILEREAALYLKLRSHLAGISFVTYGGREDLAFSKQLEGINVLCNRWHLPMERYLRLLPYLHIHELRRAKIYKTNQIPGADIALNCALRWKKRLIVRCGYLRSLNMERQYGQDSQEAQAARSLEKKVYPEADHAIVTTRSMKKFLEEQYSVGPDKISIIPNFVETDRFKPVEEKLKIRRQICFVGRLSEEKNTFALLEAIKGLDVQLLVVGRGILEDGLKCMAKEQNLPVKFLGMVPNIDLPAILSTSELFILPSHYEGHPKTLLEAMSCGLPVIGANSPGIREVVEHGQNGFLCGTQPDEIRSAIETVMGNEELKKRLAQNARQYIIDHCSLDRVAEQELELIGQMVKTRRKS